MSIEQDRIDRADRVLALLAAGPLSEAMTALRTEGEAWASAEDAPVSGQNTLQIFVDGAEAMRETFNTMKAQAEADLAAQN